MTKARTSLRTTMNSDKIKRQVMSMPIMNPLEMSALRLDPLKAVVLFYAKSVVSNFFHGFSASHICTNLPIPALLKVISVINPQDVEKRKCKHIYFVQTTKYSSAKLSWHLHGFGSSSRICSINQTIVLTLEQKKNFR